MEKNDKNSVMTVVLHILSGQQIEGLRLVGSFFNEN